MTFQTDIGLLPLGGSPNFGSYDTNLHVKVLGGVGCARKDKVPRVITPCGYVLRSTPTTTVLTSLHLFSYW